MSQCRVKHVEQGRERSGNLAASSMEPQTNPSVFAKVAQASVSKKLKPLLFYGWVITTGLSNTLTGRRWL